MSIHQDETTAASGNEDNTNKTATASSPSIDVLTCTPGELSAYLLANRFQVGHGACVFVFVFLQICLPICDTLANI